MFISLFQFSAWTLVRGLLYELMKYWVAQHIIPFFLTYQRTVKLLLRVESSHLIIESLYNFRNFCRP